MLGLIQAVPSCLASCQAQLPNEHELTCSPRRLWTLDAQIIASSQDPLSPHLRGAGCNGGRALSTTPQRSQPPGPAA